VFVFDTVIQVKTPSIKNLTPDNTIFSSIKTGVSPVKTSGALQVSDEIVCEYEGNVSTKTPKADVNDVNNIYVWATFLILLLIVLLFGFTLFQNSGVDEKIKNRMFVIFGVVGFILVIVFLSLWSKNTNKTGARIAYGSLTMMSLMFMGLSYVAFTGYFVNEQRTGRQIIDNFKDAVRRSDRVGIAP
jgi:cation transport ATPase